MKYQQTQNAELGSVQDKINQIVELYNKQSETIKGLFKDVDLNELHEYTLDELMYALRHSSFINKFEDWKEKIDMWDFTHRQLHA